MYTTKPEKQKRDSPVSFLLITIIFVLATVIALAMRIPIKRVMTGYSYNVLVILIAMELFTNLIISTGIMQFFATKLALRSHGNKRAILVFFGSMMFLISAFLNNITAVMVILPVIFVLLKAIDLDKKYIYVFFASLLAISNTGGASSPIGDFPAIVIMTSGITTFINYLLRAMPLFILTSVALIVFWTFRVLKSDEPAVQELAVDLLKSRHKHIKVDKNLLIPLVVILVMMFLAWSIIPQDIVPPEIVAILGYVIAAGICAVQGKQIKITIDFKAVLTIAAFLFLASVISSTGLLERLADILQTKIEDPRILLLTIMVITSVVAGLFSAGPAAAAMMPVIVNLCNTTLAAEAHWVAIAYAAAICAGSSLFMWSATAGFILSNKVEEANIGHSWGVGSYLKYGLINYAIQMFIALSTIAILV
jgi:Na+/H+ antiporter NhaD/arsenite permease-like protein